MTNGVGVGVEVADLVADAGTGDGLCEVWGVADGAGGVGRTIADDKTSLHCE